MFYALSDSTYISLMVQMGNHQRLSTNLYSTGLKNNNKLLACGQIHFSTQLKKVFKYSKKLVEAIIESVILAPVWVIHVNALRPLFKTTIQYVYTKFTI